MENYRPTPELLSAATKLTKQLLLFILVILAVMNFASLNYNISIICIINFSLADQVNGLSQANGLISCIWVKTFESMH